MENKKFNLDEMLSKMRREFSSGLGDISGLVKDSYDSHMQVLIDIVKTADQKYTALKLENQQLRNILAENKINIPPLPDAIPAKQG